MSDFPAMDLRPGAPDARMIGCICPDKNNRGGRGFRIKARGWIEDLGYIVLADCVMHGVTLLRRDIKPAAESRNGRVRPLRSVK